MAQPLIALAHRYNRMMVEAMVSIRFLSTHGSFQQLIGVPSSEKAGQGLREKDFTELQTTGNAWLEAFTFDAETVPRVLLIL